MIGLRMGGRYQARVVAVNLKSPTLDAPADATEVRPP
jgi:hypothetical protein